MAKLTDNTDSCKGKSFSCCQCYDLQYTEPVYSHLHLNAVRIQQLANFKNTPDRQSCCLRETVHIETDQWTVLQKELRGKKNALKGLDQLDSKIVLCEWKSSHVMSSVVLNRLQAPETVWSPSFKNTTLVLWCCCIAVQLCFCQLGVLHSVHITLKDCLIPQAAVMFDLHGTMRTQSWH